MSEKELQLTGAASARPLPAVTFQTDPKKFMEVHADVGKALQDFVAEKNLSTKIRGRDYPQVEAWTFMGSMLGLYVVEDRVIGHSDGSFEAFVTLKDKATNSERGKASSMCGDATDAPWNDRPKFARRSMAVTRAIGKVYRENYPWVMKIAGFQPTPAEEMPVDLFDCDNRDDAQRLADYLAKKKVDQSHWEKVGYLLDGRPKTAKTIDQCIEKAKG